MKVRFLTLHNNLKKLDGFKGWHLVVKVTVQIFLARVAVMVKKKGKYWSGDVCTSKAGGFALQKWIHVQVGIFAVIAQLRA